MFVEGKKMFAEGKKMIAEGKKNVCRRINYEDRRRWSDSLSCLVSYPTQTCPPSFFFTLISQLQYFSCFSLFLLPPSLPPPMNHPLLEEWIVVLGDDALSKRQLQFCQAKKPNLHGAITCKCPSEKKGGTKPSTLVSSSSSSSSDKKDICAAVEFFPAFCHTKTNVCVFGLRDDTAHFAELSAIAQQAGGNDDKSGGKKAGGNGMGGVGGVGGMGGVGGVGGIGGIGGMGIGMGMDGLGMGGIDGLDMGGLGMSGGIVMGAIGMDDSGADGLGGLDVWSGGGSGGVDVWGGMGGGGALDGMDGGDGGGGMAGGGFPSSLSVDGVSGMRASTAEGPGLSWTTSGRIGRVGMMQID